MKFKALFLVLMFLFISILSCQKNENNNSIAGTHILIEELKGYLPEDIMENSALIYVDGEGGEWRLESTFFEEIETRKVGSDEYTHDQFTIRLFDTKDPNFRIEINGYGLYDQNSDIQKTIHALLMPGNTNGSAAVNVNFENGGPIVTMFDQFEESLSIFDKTFKHVYTGKNTLSTNNAYSEISVNSDVGIVSFKDENDETWVFDRFEK